MSLSITTACSLRDYAPAANRFDECKSADGTIRPAWTRVAELVESLGQEGLAERSSTFEQLLRENGTTFLVDSEQGRQNRPWKLSALPLVIDSETWTKVEVGLAQRTRLLEAVLADLLGDQRLIKEKIIPADILNANPFFERGYHGLPSTGGNRLHITATDMARANDGTWWVTGDRTRAPSGLGYLLENRVITSRVFPQLIRQSNTRRLAQFFESLRGHLRSLAPRLRENPRVALLTPGHDSYREFEDAYLARYLGLTLVQGTDLAVRGGRLNLKTLGGLLSIEVLWRHVSDRKCDPLELSPNSVEGVTGLLRTIREDSVAVANSIGSVMAQVPALMPFLPGASRFLFGETLSLPSIATYWCGGHKECNHVLNHLDTLLIRSAFEVTPAPPVIPSELSHSEREELIATIRANPRMYIAQERVPHSTTPIWNDRQLQPWHVAIRCFQLQTKKGVEVLPGALARLSPVEHLIGRPQDSARLAQDCWVVSDEPVDSETTLLPPVDAKIVLKRSGDELPSRVAEHLFWLGRYAERGEAVARLLRTTLIRLASENELSELPELPRLITALAGIGQIEPDYAIAPLEVAMPKIEDLLPRSVLDAHPPRGLQNTIGRIVGNATVVRDRLSIDAYRIIQRAASDLNAPMTDMTIGRLIERLNRLIVDLLAFAGVLSESFTRTHAWQFLELGRRMERADQTAELLSATLVPWDPTMRFGTTERAICEAVLETSDSLMTYRSRYLNLVRVGPVIDLLVTDETNPRSIRFQLDEITRVLRKLPASARIVGLGADEKLAYDLLHQVRMADPNDLSGTVSNDRRPKLEMLLEQMMNALPRLSDAIAARYLIHTGLVQTLTGVNPTVLP